MIAASPGLTFADPYVIGLLFCGLAVFAAIGALSHQHDRAFSASVIYLGLGAGAAGGIEILGLEWLDPVEDSRCSRAAGLAVVIALFATGLKLERELTFRAWANVAGCCWWRCR